jgi:hypothetical protein
MFTNLNEQASECRRHAVNCASNAEIQSDPRLRQDFVQMERRWLGLASSYEFLERLDLLSAADTQTKNTWQVPDFAAIS